MSKKIAVLLGSLRKESYTRKVVEALSHEAPGEFTFDVVPIDRVGHYNQDLDTDTPPKEWKELRDRIRAADGVLFATPEYNRSVPGVLKNALDIASRPYGKGALNNKPAAVLSVTPGGLGAFGANHHLRQSLTFLNMPTVQQPEMYISKAADLIGEDGHARDESTRKLFANFLTTFAKLIEDSTPGS